MIVVYHMVPFVTVCSVYHDLKLITSNKKGNGAITIFDDKSGYYSIMTKPFQIVFLHIERFIEKLLS